MLSSFRLVLFNFSALGLKAKAFDSLFSLL